MAKLNIEFCNLKFENPFILAAAPPTDSLSMLERAFEYGWAGAVLKTTSVEGNPVRLTYPMITSYDYEGRKLAGMGNIDLISEHHIDVVEKRVQILKEKFPEKIVIGSIMGGKKEDWQSLVKRLKAANADAIECSFSCPQGTIGDAPGAMLGQNKDAVRTVCRWLRDADPDIPISIKLTTQVKDITEMVEICKEEGMNAITAANTIPSLMGVDINNFIPIPNINGKSTYSGFGGPAVKPISLKTISEIALKNKMPIMATGGINTWRDTIEFMSLGAGLAQFCTVVMYKGFRVIDTLKSGLLNYLEGKGFDSPKDIIGKALPNIVSHDQLALQLDIKSNIDDNLCINCGRCVIACRDGGHEAISFDEYKFPKVDDEKCVGCGLCSCVCPVPECINFIDKSTKSKDESNNNISLASTLGGFNGLRF